MAKQVFVEGTGYVLRYWLFPVVRKQHIRLLCFGVQFLRARFGHDGFAFNRVLTFVVSRSALRWSWSECEARGSRKDSKKDYLDDHCCCFVYFVLVSFFVFVGLNSVHKIVLQYAAFKFIVWLANAYSAINPFIYLLFDEKFRN